jgi:SAM-dependent methyltransferase
MRAGETRQLARRAGVGRGVSVLDLCCGVAGPGRLITAGCYCRYVGLDYSASALEIARELAGDLPCQFEQAHLPGARIRVWRAPAHKRDDRARGAAVSGAVCFADPGLRQAHPINARGVRPCIGVG